MTLPAEGFIAERLNQIEADYEREMAVAAQLHEVVETELTARSDATAIGTEDIPVRPGWEMTIKGHTFEDSDQMWNRYGDPADAPLDVSFWPLGNSAVAPADSSAAGSMLRLIVCRNGVLDDNTQTWLKVDDIERLRGDMVALLGGNVEPDSPS